MSHKLREVGKIYKREPDPKFPWGAVVLGGIVLLIIIASIG